MNIKIDFSFGVVLSMLFVILKLTGVISWSWFWVLSPIIIQFGLILLIIISALIIKALNKKGWYLF
jgi:hypothetical protein